MSRRPRFLRRPQERGYLICGVSDGLDGFSADDGKGQWTGLDVGFCRALSAAAHIIRLVGNYGEVYERNVGAGSKLGIPRGLNSLWNKGGIQYAPPIR